MRRHFEEIEEELKSQLLVMARLAQDMIATAIQGLAERKREPLEKVALLENEVNRLHIDIDNRCLTLIALHQPAAADLRFIIASIKINSDLERIGDQAVNVSESAALLLDKPQLERKLPDIPRMAALAQGMLKDGVAAFADKDVALANAVLTRDAEEDRLKSESLDALVEIMQSDKSAIPRALGLILIARNLERIADHATNIAEDVIFMTEGKDIRHHTEPPK